MRPKALSKTSTVKLAIFFFLTLKTGIGIKCDKDRNGSGVGFFVLFLSISTFDIFMKYGAPYYPTISIA